MDFLNVLETVWELMNSSIGIVIAAGILAWLLKRVYLAKPAWKAHEGTIIAAIKSAEAMIPDETPNKSLARLDAAMGYVLKVYAAQEGHAASKKVAAQLRDAIGVKHAELEKDGNLSKDKNSAMKIPVRHGD